MRGIALSRHNLREGGRNAMTWSKDLSSHGKQREKLDNFSLYMGPVCSVFQKDLLVI